MGTGGRRLGAGISFMMCGLVAVIVMSGCGGGAGGSGTGATGGSAAPPGSNGKAGAPPPQLAITSFSPASAMAGAGGFTLTVNGAGFDSASVVQVAGQAEPTSDVSATQLTATVAASAVAQGGELAVTVSDGATSSAGAPLKFEVDNPVPALTALAPASAVAGTASAVIAVTGSGFTPDTTIAVNGAARPTTFSSATEVAVTVAAADLAAAGALALTALNPVPGGGTSAAMNLNVTAAPPPALTITAVSPARIMAGTGTLTVSVSGSGFVPASRVEVAGSAEATNYVSASQLTATVPGSQIASGGELAVTVSNGTASSSGTPPDLEVDNPEPAITALTPDSAQVGATSATITVTGTGFVPVTVIEVNGQVRPTTFTNATTLGLTLAKADLAAAGTLALTAWNLAPGGGGSAAISLNVLPPQPTITAVTPNAIAADSGDTSIRVTGTGFTTNSVVEWNGTVLATAFTAGPFLLAQVPAADLSHTGTVAVDVATPASVSLISNAIQVNITSPPAPTLATIAPGGGSVETAQRLSLQGAGFTLDSVAEVNGVPVPTTYNSSISLSATLPAMAVPGDLAVSVATPAVDGAGGGVSAPQFYTAYLDLTLNDIVYDPSSGLLLGSVPGSASGGIGNTVVGLDPATGKIQQRIWVGSEPDQLALSSDGTQLFVGLDGAGAVAQVDLTQGRVVNQFSLGGGSGLYNPPLQAVYLAAVPGEPNAVAVATQSSFGAGGITIYDAGVARAHAWTSGQGPMAFGDSASTLYALLGSNQLEQLTVDATGITSAATLASFTSAASELQYDAGRLYLSTGQVLSAATGTPLGTLYSGTRTPASGPIVSDSSLGRVIVGDTMDGSGGGLLVFDASSFNQLGDIPVHGVGESGYGVTFEKVVRWGQNGLALNVKPGPFTSAAQLVILQSPLVQDLSSSPADLAVSLSAPTAASTGTAVAWVGTIKNLGPNQATGVTIELTLDPSLLVGGVQASQGECGSGTTFACNLGSLASGASASVTVSATPSQAGTLTAAASGASTSADPALDNNQATASTTVTGALYGAVPALSALSPNLVQAGAADFTLAVSGTGFNSRSIVELGGQALATTFVSPTQLTAAVAAAAVAHYGWAPVTVSNPAPGGGASQPLPLTIYDLVNVPASAMVFDPYARMLYATIPSTATTLTGNSVVSIDPTTGAVGTPIAVGSEPTVIAESTDGTDLFIGLSGSASLAAFDLKSQAVTATFPLNVTRYGIQTTVAATWLATMPGSDTTLAIGLADDWRDFGIFDISGSTGAFRPNFSGIYEGDDPVFADPSHVYAVDLETSGAEFYRYNVDASGLNLIDGSTLLGLGRFQLGTPNGLVYGAGGGIVNPATTPPSQLARLPGGEDDAFTLQGSGLAADPSLNKEFLMVANLTGAGNELRRYNLTTFLSEATLTMPGSLSAFDSGRTLLRWGQDGLALLSASSNGTNQQISEVMLLRGPFVVPQELGASSAATLAGSPATTLQRGSSNTILTLAGTNFQPGVAVTWNGSYRTTTIVDATHVTVAIPASDLTSSRSVSLVATNPGAPASNPLTITIQ